MGIIKDNLDWSWPVGRSERVKECDNCIGEGNSNAVQVTRKEDGFLWHCFRCDLSGFHDDGSASPTQVEEMHAARLKGKRADTRPLVVTLPEYAAKFNPQGLVDLYDFFVEPEDIARFNIGWSAVEKRIIFPLYKYGTSKGDWARKLSGWSGKKLSTDVDNPKKWYTIRQRDVKHPRFVAVPLLPWAGKKVVLVEDPISATRVSQMGYIGIGLMTTYLPYELYPVLRGWDVKLWFDEDAMDKACKFQAKLGANGVTANVIMTKRDPKKLTPEEMKEKLQWQN